MTVRGRSEPRGFVAIELLLAIGLLLLPVILLVASLPQWSERQHAATSAADDAARAGIAAWPASGAERAQRAAIDVLETYGVPDRDARIDVSPPPDRGGLLTVTIVSASVLPPGPVAVM